jgi:hypothetical protein
MLIVDAQIHLWEKGTPSPHHRQEPYSAEEAIAGMDAASVDRALIHPVLWDPDSNELAVEAVRKYPARFAIMGWFYLDDPNGRDLVAQWKERSGMLGLRFYTNEQHPQSWFTDGTLGWLWPTLRGPFHASRPKTKFAADSALEGAVSSEPVSALNSLFNRENTGNFIGFGLSPPNPWSKRPL